jgi:hypothetical protein
MPHDVVDKFGRGCSELPLLDVSRHHLECRFFLPVTDWQLWAKKAREEETIPQEQTDSKDRKESTGTPGRMRASIKRDIV